MIITSKYDYNFDYATTGNTMDYLKKGELADMIRTVMGFRERIALGDFAEQELIDARTAAELLLAEIITKLPRKGEWARTWRKKEKK